MEAHKLEREPKMKSKRADMMKFIIIVFVFVTQMGCVAPAEKGMYGHGALEQDEGVIFGTLDTVFLDKNGVRLSPEEQSSALSLSYKLRYSLAKTAGLMWLAPNFEREGMVFAEGYVRNPRIHFSKRLPAGDYSIHLLYFNRSYSRQDIRFKVAAKQITYIGSIQIVFRSAGIWQGLERVDNKIQYGIVNDITNTTPSFAKSYPELSSYPVFLNLAKVQK